ncbi:MAG TPA: TonB-dependent receptor [Thermoanaerobaculia bacterium]|nr:TonB-dependent receptor [Thermoanaerobaculia bacterium]
MKSFRASIAALLLLVAASVAQAATTGTLFGTVTDGDGSALPGVTVTVSSPSLQGTRSTVTNAAGEYSFPILPPGVYRIEYALPSFEALVRQGVVVNLDQATRVSVVLSLTRVTEDVTVTADTVVIDPTQTNTQVNLKEDHLKYATVGLARRSYQNVVLEAPGVTSQAGSGGNPSVFGSNLGQSSYLIDGLNTTDPVTHTFTSNFTFDSIQEIAIQTSGFEAEYGKAIGGIINVITQSGGNEFHGTLDGRHRSEKLTEEGEETRDFPAGTETLRYDRDRQDFQNFSPSATLGGPLLRDRIWFFGSVERPQFENQPADLFGFQPGRRDFQGWTVFAKATATPAASHTLALKFNSETADVPHAQNSSFYTPEAGYDQSQDLRIYNASYDAVLNPSWLANFQVGYLENRLDARPHSGDLDTTGTIDQVTGIASGNYTNVQTSERPRLQALASTSYLAEFLGSHVFKLGTDLEWTKFENLNNVTGTPLDPSFCSPQFGQPAGATCGAINEPADGDNFLYLVYTDLPVQTFEGRGMSFYAQDEWRPVQNLTAKLGLRYDEADFYLPGDEKVKTFARFQPRVGIAWDLFNNASTIVKANAGEFMEDNALTLPSFLSRQGSVLSLFLWSNAQQRYRFFGAFGGPSGNALDPSMRPTYSQQVTGGVTQRIFKNTSLDVTGIYRRNKNVFEDTCADEDCTFYWLTNHPNGMDVLNSNYRGLIFKVESRPTDGMSWIFSYTTSKSRSAVEYTQNAGSDFDVFPEHFVNRFGYTSDDARHVVKLDGYVRLPWELFLGTSAYWDSGIAYNVTRPAASYGVEFVEPRGSRRLPDFYRWDAQLQKDFPIGPVRLGLIAAVFNILDTEIATQRDRNVGDGGTIGEPTNPRFNFATAWQRPRSYELGFRIEF